MPDILLHPLTERAIQRFIERPSHAVLLVGPAGIGKCTLARHLGARLLDVSDDSLANNPHVIHITSEDNKAISIEAIRDLQQRLALKVPGNRTVARLVIIENAQLMTTEAQNALLKSLEEPPLDTVIILTAITKDAVLPTIQSRTSIIEILPPPVDKLRSAIELYTSDGKLVDSALMLSGSLPGLATALARLDTQHPLYQATVQARQLLQSKAYERLLGVDQLSKQKQLCVDIVFILGQMARTALLRAAGSKASADRWQRILTASFAAERQLLANAQTKLVMTNLLLDL